jgi:hypothetical protein
VLSLAALAFGAFAPSAYAQGQTFEGARLLGLAESQRALTTQNDSIYLNPAGLALGSIYSAELGYLDDFKGTDRRFNASIIDSQAGPIAGGLAYTYSRLRPAGFTTVEDRLRYHRFDVSLATRVAESASIGLTARYLIFDRYLGDTKLEGAGYNIFTIDAGIQWRIVQGLSLGVSGYNLTNSKRPEIPISWGAGLGYQLGTFSIEGDVRYNAQKGKALYSLGAGYVIADTVPLRAGVSYDLLTESFAISGGLGFILDRFSIDLGFRQRLSGDTPAGEEQPRLFAVCLRGAFF